MGYRIYWWPGVRAAKPQKLKAFQHLNMKRTRQIFLLLCTAKYHNFVTRTSIRHVWVFAIVNPSVCCLSVTFVHSTQGLKLSAMFIRHCLPLTSLQNFTEIVPGEPIRWGVKRKRGSKIERWWIYRRLYLINGGRYGLWYD